MWIASIFSHYPLQKENKDMSQNVKPLPCDKRIFQQGLINRFLLSFFPEYERQVEEIDPHEYDSRCTSVFSQTHHALMLWVTGFLQSSRHGLFVSLQRSTFWLLTSLSDLPPLLAPVWLFPAPSNMCLSYMASGPRKLEALSSIKARTMCLTILRAARNY